MTRRVQLVLLCEDTQHEAFLRRILKRDGWSTRRLRVNKAPSGEGSGEQYVRDQFPVELSAYRSNRNRVTQELVVMIDGDKKGVVSRMEELDKACREGNVKPRQNDERAAVFVPTWCIETWFAYLDGDTVDENKSDYPKLPREGQCQRHVDELHRMCRKGELRGPFPPSLGAACKEFRLRLAKPD